MAEVVVVVSGIVSIAQLAVYVVKTIKAVTNFRNAIKNAPTSIQKIEKKLGTLKDVVEKGQTYQELFHDDIILPPDLRQVFFEAVKKTNEIVVRIQTKLELVRSSSKETIKGKIVGATTAKRQVECGLQELKHSEELLDNVIQLISLYELSILDPT